MGGGQSQPQQSSGTNWASAVGAGMQQFGFTPEPIQQPNMPNDPINPGGVGTNYFQVLLDDMYQRLRAQEQSQQQLSQQQIGWAQNQTPQF